MFLLQVKLEDVFQSTRQSMSQPVGTNWVPLAVAVAAVLVLLAALHARRRREALPAALNSPRKLLREVAKAASLSSGELKHLKEMAEKQGCASPLTLLICPSLLAKGLAARPPDERKALAGVVKRLNARGGKT